MLEQKRRPHPEHEGAHEAGCVVGVHAGAFISSGTVARKERSVFRGGAGKLIDADPFDQINAL
jgi:hypothetical protein